MAVASVTKITAASSESFDAAVREGLARASRGIRFFRVRTETGRELIADGQRALYTLPPVRSRVC
jgi:flavin-binding protein dodecin